MQVPGIGFLEIQHIQAGENEEINGHRGLVHPTWPFSGRMEDAENLHGVTAHAIGQDV